MANLLTFAWWYWALGDGERFKALMMTQAMLSLLVTGVILAWAVNTL